MGSDLFGRPTIGDAIKKQIDQALQGVPDGKRGALLIIADENGTRATLAARIDNHWKVSAGGGVAWDGKVTGSVALAGVW